MQNIKPLVLTDQEKKRKACERTRLWRKNNPEKKRQANILWELNNPEKAKESKHKWSRNNKEKRREYQTLWRLNNRDRYLAQKRLNYQRHRLDRLKYLEQWTGNNPEYKRQYNKNNPGIAVNNEHIRRARKKQVPCEVIVPMVVFEENKWICQLCFKPVDKTLKHPNPLSASLDHIIPLSKGGSHTRGNVQLTHLKCNVKASVKNFNKG
jgi:hypothetical protein